MAQDTSPFESQVRRGAFVAGDAGHLLALKSKMMDPDLDPVQTMLSMGGDHLGLVEKWRASHLQSTSQSPSGYGRMLGGSGGGEGDGGSEGGLGGGGADPQIRDPDPCWHVTKAGEVVGPQVLTSRNDLTGEPYHEQEAFSKGGIQDVALQLQGASVQGPIG